MNEQRESIFTVLSSYCPQPAMTPKENYLTELLAWIINNVEIFSERFVERLITEAKERGEFVDISTVTKDDNELEQDIVTVTQQYVSCGYIDMLVYDKRHKIAFICEHKINSSLSDNQIIKYMERTAELQPGFHYVSVLLAKSKNIKNNEQAKIKIAWSEITQLTTKTLNDDTLLLTESERFILEQFVSFMNAEGLGMTEPISGETLKEYLHLIDDIKKAQHKTEIIKNRISQIFRSLADSDVKWKKEIPELSSFPGIREDIVCKYEKYRWGRIGINFSDRPWDPGLFAGVILDVEDHKLQLVDPNKGPDIVVLLDVEAKNKCEHLVSEKDWNLHLKERRNKGQIIQTANHTWKFSYGIEVKSDWRIAVLQTPLLDVISYCDDFEKQQDRIKECLIEGIRLIVPDTYGDD